MFSDDRHIHLMNPLSNAAGGSENRTLNLYHELSPHIPVTIWSQREPDPRLAGGVPVRRIRTKRLIFPKTGTFVFVGVYSGIGRWIWLTRPRRVIIVYNTPDSQNLATTLRRFSRIFNVEPELVYCSRLMREQAGLPGIVEPSLFDLSEFVPVESPHREFVVGRLSRPNMLKHHPGDAALYRRLAAEGCRVKVMGPPDTMFDQLKDAEAITLLPSCAIGASRFLQGLDCFFFRTDPAWREPWGRVVTEAMACGLPVVIERRVGSAEIIDHGRNGFLFDTEEEAFQILLALKEDAALRHSVGKAARATVEDLVSAEARARIIDFYVQ